MKRLLLALPVVLLAACGGEETDQKADAVELSSSKDSLSYAFGSMEAQRIIGDQSPVYQKIDNKELFNGFKAGIEAGEIQDEASACMATIQKFYDMRTGQIDTTYMAEGSRCYGTMTAAYIYDNLNSVNELNSIDMTMMLRGFEDALSGADTVITEDQKMNVIQAFNVKVSTRLEAEMVAAEQARWDKIKAIPGILELEGGIYLETVKAGTGAQPGNDSDIEATYVLYDFGGNVMQDSKDSGSTFTANLDGGVIQGWAIGMQAMKKGGVYKLYIPSNMAYNKGSLAFDIELLNVGTKGSIHTPRMPGMR